MIISGRHRLELAWGVAAIPLLLVFPQVRYVLESRMALHMLLELPLLLAAGWAASALVGNQPGFVRHYDAIDVDGLLGTALVTSLSLFWMFPVSLDLSLLSLPIQLVKYAGWWLVGAGLRRTFPRLADESLLFFFGGMSWMLATAGMLYQSSETRLCVNYLMDDQLIAGRGLVVAAVLLGTWALIRLARPRTRGKSRSTQTSGPQAAIVQASDRSGRVDSAASGSQHQL